MQGASNVLIKYASVTSKKSEFYSLNNDNLF